MASYNIDWSRCATTPRQHQTEGVLKLLTHPAFLLADEVGAGKSKQIVDTSQILYEGGEINAVVVLCPAAARGVWANPHPALGEVARHGWPSIPNYIMEYSVKHSNLVVPKEHQKDLLWLVTNYEFVRREERLAALVKFLVTSNLKYWLVCDEAWALKDAKTDQWKAAWALRQRAARVVMREDPERTAQNPLHVAQFYSRITLLNGTPIADSPLDTFAQMKLLDPGILGIKYFSHFRARYAILRPNVSFPMIVGWQNLDELITKTAPYVLRRTTRECFDLPPILDPILLEAKLSDETWKLYRQMRDDMVAWLKAGEASVAQQAITKGMRLAQITSGFIGGVQQLEMGGELDFGSEEPACIGGQGTEFIPVNTIREIGREKLDALLAWLPTVSPVPERVLIWCRFRAEVERTAEALKATGRQVHRLYGQQPIEEREAAVISLAPDVQPDGLVAVVGNPLAGGAALNLAGASVAVYMSNDFNLRVRLQSMGRIDRYGQRNPIRYVDVVATGPKGQRTIDHHILAALRSKDDIAKWTAAAWRQKLLDE